MKPQLRVMADRAMRLLVLAVCSLGLSSWAQGAENKPNKTVIVMVDLSDSTEAHRPQYVKDFRRILDAMEDGDRLLVSRIIKHASDRDPLPIELTVEKPGWDSNSKIVGRKNAARKTLALLDFERIVSQTDKETPILEVMAKVPRWFSNHKNARQIVVVMSDMREHSTGQTSLEKKGSTTPQMISATLDRLTRQGAIPDLQGVKVYVAGARDKDAARLLAVRQFWSTYFERAKADFSVNRYAERLEAFAECGGPQGACPGRYFQEGGEAALRSKEAELRKALGQQSSGDAGATGK